MVGSGADLVRFIQHGVVENRMCAFAPSQRGCVGVVFEAKESLGGTPAVRRRLAGSFAQLMSVTVIIFFLKLSWYINPWSVIYP